MQILDGIKIKWSSPFKLAFNRQLLNPFNLIHYYSNKRIRVFVYWFIRVFVYSCIKIKWSSHFKLAFNRYLLNHFNLIHYSNKRIYSIILVYCFTYSKLILNRIKKYCTTSDIGMIFKPNSLTTSSKYYSNELN